MEARHHRRRFLNVLRAVNGEQEASLRDDPSLSLVKARRMIQTVHTFAMEMERREWEEAKSSLIPWTTDALNIWGVLYSYRDTPIARLKETSNWFRTAHNVATKSALARGLLDSKSAKIFLEKWKSTCRSLRVRRVWTTQCLRLQQDSTTVRPCHRWMRKPIPINTRSKGTSSAPSFRLKKRSLSPCGLFLPQSRTQQLVP